MKLCGVFKSGLEEKVSDPRLVIYRPAEKKASMYSSGGSRFAGQGNFPEKDIALRDLGQIHDDVPEMGGSRCERAS